MAMTVEIKNNKLCIEIDLETPTPSASGKTLVVASTRGNAVTTAEVNGKPIIIGIFDSVFAVATLSIPALKGKVFREFSIKSTKIYSCIPKILRKKNHDTPNSSARR